MKILYKPLLLAVEWYGFPAEGMVDLTMPLLLVVASGIVFSGRRDGGWME